MLGKSSAPNEGWGVAIKGLIAANMGPVLKAYGQACDNVCHCLYSTNILNIVLVALSLSVK